ncbi:hypothetical protein M758_12G138500 [Ceratodon purpureus]|uniref:Uncharacterized protein n=1 Tax=Ceratodon purpureus TaxID=3225 RepID=A0A8T0G6T7_CERPU|nr:hypothetical protein KC19_12G135400 [Ceratodon purpureus]KAG0599248.1 hypothetical protein M758_12G138500 [Ceratodon purpureus]
MLRAEVASRRPQLDPRVRVGNCLRGLLAAMLQNSCAVSHSLIRGLSHNTHMLGISWFNFTSKASEQFCFILDKQKTQQECNRVVFHSLESVCKSLLNEQSC